MQRLPEVETAFSPENRYTAESLPIFAKHVDAQLKAGESDLEVNLSILKIMSIHTGLEDATLIRKVLLLAISAYPQNDFSLCMFQIPERLHTGDKLKRVIDIAHLLELTKFSLFWREAESSKELDECTNWRGKIRGFITEVVMLTYNKIELADFAELVNLKDDKKAARKLVEARGLSIEGSDEGDTILINQLEPVEDAKPMQLTFNQLKDVLVCMR
jgi:hypothetical protein